jgi:long-chain acyl-CoA synthetase
LLEKFKSINGNVQSLKVFVCGGSVLSEENYFKIKKAFNIDLLHGYGLTEFAPVSRNIRGQARPGTIGPLCEDIDCEIDSKEKKTGEILIKTDKMFRGYYNRRKATEEAFRGEWFKTGDIGKIEDGHLIFKKEKKKTRKANGNLIDLLEMEKIIKLNNKNKHNDLKTFLQNKIASYKIPLTNPIFRSF